MMDWLSAYFIDPLVKGTGYNIVNTLFFGIVFIIFLFIIEKVSEKMKIKFDEKLFFSLAPFIILGGVLRALQDTGFFNFLGYFRFLFVTPGIYFLIFSIVLISLWVEKKGVKNFAELNGVVLAAFFLTIALLESRNWSGFLIAVSLALISFFLSFLLFRKFLKSMEAWTAVFAHSLDACSSVTAILIVGGFWEQHVLPKFLLNAGLFWLFIPLKILFVLFVSRFIEEESRGNWRWLFLFSLVVLGLGPGTRDALAILLH